MHSVPPPHEVWPEALPDLLRWTGGSVTAARNLRSRLLDRSAECVGAIIARHAPSPRSTLEELLSLPNCERILLAPAVTSFVARDFAGRTDGEVDAWTFLSRSLAAEKALAASSAVERPLWTALGDTYLPAGHTANELVEIDTGPCWRAGTPYFASRILGDTVVDAFSPGAVGWLPDVALGDGAFTSSAYNLSIQKLLDACNTIAAASPHAADTVGTIARVILLRSDAQLHEFRAASSPIGIGRIVLRNPHLTDATVLEIVDGLVHETIHGLVDVVELDAPLVGTSFSGQSASSPWTGRMLDLRTYLHACFVWYGLWQFWSQLATRSHDAALARRYIALCTRGFVSDGGILAPISKLTDLLSTGVLEVLEQLQSEVTA